MADRQVFIDVLGLAPTFLSTAERTRYIESLGLEGTQLRTENERLQTLARLHEGAGVTVLTGPLAAPFWSWCSLEVKVRVVPDDIEAPVGVTDLTAWSLMSVGVAASAAVRHAATYSTEKPPRGALRPQWDAAETLRGRLQSAAATVSANPIVVEAFHTELVTDHVGQLQLLDSIHEFTSLDFEWNKKTKEPLGLSVSTADKTWYLPAKASDFELPVPQRRALAAAGLAFMKRNPTVWHNAKADFQTQYAGDPLELHGSTQPAHDTLIMAYLLGKTNLKLKELSRTELGRDPGEYPGELEDLPVALAGRYAGPDTRNTFDLFKRLEPQLQKDGQWQVYDQLERPIVPMVASMEKYGTPVDPVEVKRLRDQLAANEERYRYEVLTDYGLDVAVEDQRRAYLSKRAGWKIGSMSKDSLAKVHTEWMTDDLRFAQLRHQRRSFVEKHLERWTRMGEPEVLWAYTNFNQAGAALFGDTRGFRSAPRTGRFSSSSPDDEEDRLGFGNLQNQPRGQRSIFIAGPCPVHGLMGLRTQTICCDQMPLFWSFDYSGLELHIAAARSRDSLMLATLGADPPGDLHQAFLDRIIALTGVDVGRPVAKQGNFEQLYGGGADKLVQILALQRAFISYDVAKTVVQAHHDTFTGYHAYTGSVIEEARLNGGSAYTLMGRKRNEARDLFGKDADRRGWAERALVNMTIQGTAADILKRAMDWSVPVLREFDAHLALQVHDELCGWVPAGNAVPFKHAMTALMGAIPLPGLKLHVEGGVALTWAAAH